MPSGTATALPSLAVIRLDAATVLLQWAVGGLLFLWVTTRGREVGIGYGWLVRGIYILMAAGRASPWACGSTRCRSARRRRWRSLVAASVALGVSIVRRKAGVAGERARVERRSARVAAMTGIDRAGRRPGRRRCRSSRPGST